MKNVNINSILVKTFTEYTSIFYSSLQDQLTVVLGSYFQTTFCKMSTNTNINKVLQKQGFIFVVANGKFRRGPRSILPKFAGACFSEKKKKKKKKKKSSTNVLGVVLRYLLTKIFLAAKSPSRNNNSQDR